MQPTGGIHDAADLTGLERKRRVLKLLLHVAAPKVPQVAPLAGGRAVGLGQGQLAERDGPGLDALFELLEDLARLLFGAGDFGLDTVNRVLLVKREPSAASKPSAGVSRKGRRRQHSNMQKGRGVFGGAERTSRQELGLLLWLCLTSKCAHLIFPCGCCWGPWGGGEWYLAM